MAVQLVKEVRPRVGLEKVLPWAVNRLCALTHRRKAMPIEELIEVAEDSPVTSSQIPPDSNPKTISRIKYEVLIENPYRYTEREFFRVVHCDIRGRLDLKIDSYNIKRAVLVRNYGWGIHRKVDGTLALVPMESERYKELQRTIKRAKSYRTNRAGR